MNFSIIIINFNTARLTLNCVDSIYKLPNFSNFEVIVVDNGSSNDDLEIINNALDKRVKLLESKENLGFAGGNNLGAKYAKGKYLLFLNSDTIIKDNIFSVIEKTFLNDSSLGIVSPQLLNEDGSPQAKAYGPFPSIRYLLYKNIFSRRDNHFPKKIDWVSGAALFIRKDVFEEVGGWDENFFLYLEDVDLCWMVRSSGYKIFLNDSVEVTHLQGMSLKYNKEKQKYYHRSQDYLFKKHYSKFTRLIFKIIHYPFYMYFLIKK